MKSVKALAILAILCAAVLGLLFVFGIISLETVTHNAGAIAGGIIVIAVAVVAIGALGGRGGGDETDPPPIL